MTWIRTIPPEEAEGALEEVYRRAGAARGKVSNVLMSHSLKPDVVRTHLDLYLAILFAPSSLSRAQREMIGVVVSAANGCEYCVRHHGIALARYWKDEEKVWKFALDYAGYPLPLADRVLVDFVARLTEDPAASREEDLEPLRRAGFDDEGILTAVLAAGYFNFVNRIVQALGVEFTAEESRGYKV